LSVGTVIFQIDFVGAVREPPTLGASRCTMHPYIISDSL